MKTIKHLNLHFVQSLGQRTEGVCAGVVSDLPSPRWRCSLVALATDGSSALRSHDNVQTQLQVSDVSPQSQGSKVRGRGFTGFGWLTGWLTDPNEHLVQMLIDRWGGGGSHGPRHIIIILHLDSCTLWKPRFSLVLFVFKVSTSGTEESEVWSQTKQHE